MSLCGQLTAILFTRIWFHIGNDAKYFQDIRTGRHNILFVIIEKMTRYRILDAGRRMRLFTHRKHNSTLAVYNFYSLKLKFNQN